MMTMRITRDDTGDQDAAAAPMQQHPRYGRALALCGAEVRRLAIAKDDGEVFGRAQVVTRRLGPLALSMIGRGPVWHGPGAAGRQRAALRQIARGVGPLVAIPAAQAAPMPRGPGLIALMTPAHHAVLDLGPGPATLRAGLGGKWRNRLVRAEADGVAITRARDVGWLLAAEAGQARARGYRSLPARFTEAWVAAGDGGATDGGAADGDGYRLYEAHAGGARIAAMLFLTHRPWASYHIGWSGEEGRRRNAHGLILWRAITDLAAEGLAALDLGTVDTEAAPGLARFKIGTGARVAPLGPTLLVLPALTRRRC
jgi:lipid II:glycine glycyltransferase (peptidoglycan interpeptide bridge formation enzyme)